jgi:hypothetical protein
VAVRRAKRIRDPRIRYARGRSIRALPRSLPILLPPGGPANGASGGR